MSKMSKVVKQTKRQGKFNEVTNFMGGTNYKINPLDTLKIVSASSIFGEPAYYRNGSFSTDKKIEESRYNVNRYVKSTLLDNSYESLSTTQIMEKVIDESLSYDFGGTIEWAARLRSDEFLMRLNPQVIMVRAAQHPNRADYCSNNPGKFDEINQLVMSRMDEPAVQLTYWLYKHGEKAGIPSILKKSWANKYNKEHSRYKFAKYKNAGIGMIDTIRICHASGKKNPLIEELMKTGTVAFEDDNATWESLRSQGKTWLEIINTISIPHMALLRNLRNIFTEIEDINIAKTVLAKLESGVLKGKQFPFRYYTAKQVIESNSNIHHRPLILDSLEKCMDIATQNLPTLPGKTMCLSDNSGSAWGSFNSEYGSVTIADIANLSSIITAKNSEEGYAGAFGDKLNVIPVSKRNGLLSEHQKLTNIGKTVGGATENGIWLFFKQAIDNKEHWDNIFIYSDQQAGHGRLYGTDSCYNEYRNKYSASGKYINVMTLIEEYRKINPKVNVFSIQVAGYDNVLVPENCVRTSILYGWSGKELLYADKINKMWDEIDKQKNQSI